MKKRRSIVIVTGVVAIVGAAVIGLIASGYVTITIGKSKSQASSASIVCGEDMLSRYNEAILARPTDDPTVSVIDKEGLAKIATDIKNHGAYKDDPTCQTMLFWIALQDKNYDDAKAAYEGVSHWYDEHVYANSDIRGNAPLSDWKLPLDELSPEAQNQDPSIGAGDDD